MPLPAGAQVQSLVGKLGSHKPCSMARKKKQHWTGEDSQSAPNGGGNEEKQGSDRSPGAHTCQSESTGSEGSKNDPPGLMPHPLASLEDQGDPHYGALSRSLRKRECEEMNLKSIFPSRHLSSPPLWSSGQRPESEATQLLNGKQKPNMRFWLTHGVGETKDGDWGPSHPQTFSCSTARH